MMTAEELRLTGMWSEKDLNLKISSCNKALAYYTGLSNINKIIGLTDYDFCWKEYAEIYAAHERDGLKGKNYSMIVPVKISSGETKLFFDTKFAKKDTRGKITGIICRSIEVMNPSWNKLITLLNNKSPSNNFHYCIDKPSDSKLTKKEEEVLFYLTYGKRAKNIAMITNRSTRTIEHHLENIKHKLSCNNITDLVAHAISNGLVQKLPQETVDKLIKKIEE